MNAEPQHTCPNCGNEFSAAMKSCPVCRLRLALAGEGESGKSSFEEVVKSTPEQVAQRFEHYELINGEDGKPVELGRGAMGITYKAFDVDLRCPVTLKIIGVRSPWKDTLPVIANAHLQPLSCRTDHQLEPSGPRRH